MGAAFPGCFTTTSKSTFPKLIPNSEIQDEMETIKINDITVVELEEIKKNKSAKNSTRVLAPNIILNHDFSNGLHSWHLNCCDGYIASSGSGISKNSMDNYVIVTNRKEWWQGLEQDITTRVSLGTAYKVFARVGASESSNVKATLKLEYQNSNTDFLFIGSTNVSTGKMENLEGTFTLTTMPKRIIFYLEGPSPGINILVHYVMITFAICHAEHENLIPGCGSDNVDNIILNPKFDDGVSNWSGRGCEISLYQSLGDGKVIPQSGKFFLSTKERKDTWNGIQQEITERVKRKLAYDVIAIVRIFGGNVSSTDVKITLWVKTPNLREQYISIASVQAKNDDWAVLQGSFLLNANPSRVVIYLEGPPKDTDILLNGLIVKHTDKPTPSCPPAIENVGFGVNILQNGNVEDSSDGWFPLGNCTLSIRNGAPHMLPQMARDSLGPHEPISGRCLCVTNRTQTWMGPAQMLTNKIKLFLTYQVSAWVRVSSGIMGPQNVNIALSVDDQWVNAGQVEVNDNTWHEIGGSFRIEKNPSKVMVYIQGPAPSVDFMAAGIQIFPVNRYARFKYLKNQTDKVRKRDVTLKLLGSKAKTCMGAVVIVRQIQNSFPIGSCISRTNIDNEDFVDFFLQNFNWAVFGNELKWYWTEPQQGNLNYAEADELLDLCKMHNIEARGHCIFWEVEYMVQQWVKSLSKTDLARAVEARLAGLLTRYKGKFRHYDVNNEMLHGSFFQDRLGKDFRANMFKAASQIDPSAALFVNDYHVEDGCDSKSSPEKYIQHILNLQDQNAIVGGIGIQGHIDSPVGPIVCSALDKLGVLGIPIWFTELDVSSINEYVRADDLEVMLREIFAHPSVEGIMLWGFWELFMSRKNAHLVSAEGDLNEAGRRFIELKVEWLTRVHGHVNEHGEFGFRGFHGTYELDIIAPHFEEVTKTFVVEKGASPVEVSILL